MCKIVIKTDHKKNAAKCFDHKIGADTLRKNIIAELDPEKYHYPPIYEVVEVRRKKNNKLIGYSVASIGLTMRCYLSEWRYGQPIDAEHFDIVYIDQSVIEHMVDARLAMYSRNWRKAEKEIELIKADIEATNVYSVRKEIEG